MILPRSTPRDQDVDAQGIVAFLDAVQERGIELHSFMLARHGHVVAEGWWRPYAAERAQLVYSVSKSLTSTAVGFLVHEGVISLDDPVLDHLPHLAPQRLHPNWSRVTVRHCLTMTVGHDADAWDPAFVGTDADVRRPGTDWLPIVLAMTPEHDPGTTFAYNQVATYLLSRVVHGATGCGLVDLLRPRLLEPLGIAELPWQRDPMGHELGFTGAHLTAEALLAVTQLWLDRGSWQGRQLLAPEWFDEASRPFGPPNRDPAGNADSVLGYGYSFWTSRHGYRADGAFGQFGLVLPEQDAAVAMTAESGPTQEVLDAFWETAFPAIGATGSRQADGALGERLDGLGLPARSGGAPRIAVAEFQRGDDPAELGLAPTYTGVSVRPDGSGHLLRLRRGDDWLGLRVGDGEWLESVIEAADLRLPVRSSGGWVTGDEFVAEVFVIETPHRFRVEAQLGAGEATLTWRKRPLSGSDPFSLAVRST